MRESGITKDSGIQGLEPELRDDLQQVYKPAEAG